MFLEHDSQGPEQVRLWGRKASLEVSCPLRGVLRLRHAPLAAASSFHHPELPPKHSWSVTEHEALAIELTRRDQSLSISADGVSLELPLPNGGWVFRDGVGRPVARCQEVSGEVREKYPQHEYRTRLALLAQQGEAYLGFGEKVGPLDKRGMHLTFWNTDAAQFHADTDPLHLTVPFFIGLREGVAWGAFLDETWRSEVDVALQDPSLVVFENSGPELDLYLIAGPTPADVVARFARLTGLPPLPPLWALGVHQSRWGYASARAVLDVIQGYRSRDLPLDAVYLDIDYMDGYRAFTWNRSRFPAPAELVKEAEAAHVRLVAGTSPFLKNDSGWSTLEQAKSADYLVRYERGDVLVGEAFPGQVVYPDFSRAEVQSWWGKLHAPFVDAGIAGIKVDHNEPLALTVAPALGGFDPTGERPRGYGKVEGRSLPYDAQHGDRSHLELHNVYGLAMAKATAEGLKELSPGKRPFVLTRAGFAGVQRYAAVWTGDCASSWTDLEASIPMLLGLGLSGVPFAGADVGGYSGRPSGELLARWTQAGTFYPLMRNHSAKDAPAQEPWRFDEPYLSAARAAMERRYRLLPTLYTLLWEAARTGLPVMRPLLLHAPSDRDAINASDQFFFGRDLLVAPILRPGQSRRMVYLPEGSWLEFTNLEPPAAIVEGAQYIIADGPLDTIPIWLRAGGVVALTAPAGHTTTANWASLEWHVHAAAEVYGVVYEDEGDGYGESRVTELHGRLDSTGFVLRRQATGALTLNRKLELLRIYGLPSVSSVSGAIEHSYEDGLLELRIKSDWDRIDVRV